MDIKPVFQPPDQCAGHSADEQADQQHQGFCNNRGKAFVVSDQHCGCKSGQQHLPRDTDIEQTRLKGGDKCQRSQNQRCKIVQEVQQIRQHAASAAVVFLRNHPAALKETAESNQRVFPHRKQQDAGRRQRHQDRQQRNPEGSVLPGQSPGKEHSSHASFTPII